MPCDTQVKKNQTLSERMAEVRQTVDTLARALAAGTVKAVVGKQGAIAFDGFPDAQRNGVTDACLYRRIMSSGTAMARARIAQAERLAGRSADKRIIGQGIHSHDGGSTWHQKG
jgi:hypothetical protein